MQSAFQLFCTQSALFGRRRPFMRTQTHLTLDMNSFPLLVYTVPCFVDITNLSGQLGYIILLTKKADPENALDYFSQKWKRVERSALG